MGEGFRTLTAAFEAKDPTKKRLRPPQPPVQADWLTTQQGHLRKVREAAEAVLATARAAETKLREAYESEVREVRRRYRSAGGPLADAERRGELRGAKRRYVEALGTLVRETHDAVTAHAAEARDLLQAADNVTRAHLDPFNLLRRATRGPRGAELSEVEAMSYRAATIAVAEAAGYKELGGMAQGFLDEGNRIGLHAVLLALEKRRPEDRPVTPGELRAAIPLPELEAGRAQVTALFTEGRNVAEAWEAWADDRPDAPSGTGVKKLAAAIATRGSAFEGIAMTFERLAKTPPRELRDLSLAIAETTGGLTPSEPSGPALLEAAMTKVASGDDDGNAGEREAP